MSDCEFSPDQLKPRLGTEFKVQPPKVPTKQIQAEPDPSPEQPAANIPVIHPPHLVIIEPSTNPDTIELARQYAENPPPLVLNNYF